MHRSRPAARFRLVCRQFLPELVQIRFVGLSSMLVGLLLLLLIEELEDAAPSLLGLLNGEAREAHVPLG